MSSVLALWPAQTMMHENGRSPSSAWCQAPPWPHAPAPQQDSSCAPAALPPRCTSCWIQTAGRDRICQFSLTQKPKSGEHRVSRTSFRTDSVQPCNAYSALQGWTALPGLGNQLSCWEKSSRYSNTRQVFINARTILPQGI